MPPLRYVLCACCYVGLTERARHRASCLHFVAVWLVNRRNWNVHFSILFDYEVDCCGKAKLLDLLKNIVNLLTGADID